MKELKERMKKSLILSAGLWMAASLATFAQDGDYTNKNAEISLQWQHADMGKDGKPGTSAKKAYDELVKDKKSTTVVVAIIDSGTESFHPDLKANIWVNEDEIAGNGIDDDKNGYIDDVHGWSFIGGAGGDVSYDNLEFTRIYRDLKKRFEKQDPKSVSSADKSDYARYLKMKADYEKRIDQATKDEQTYNEVKDTYKFCDEMLTKELGKDYTMEALKAYAPTGDQMKAIRGVMIQLRDAGLPGDFPDWEDQVKSSLKYQLDLDFDPRYMVGDDYSNSREKIYGNNHVDGPHADHGTHVGGIVGAARNGYGMDGICADVRLMIIRCVPNGDERDKDVANAIRYAADNGARVINMSFGKSFSPQKEVVDEAVKYAESKGVLLVHAAGNDGKNLEKEANFPTDKYNDGTFCSTWLEVGASDDEVPTLAASFSNYGQKSVDLFSPGVDIFSTVPDGKYKNNDGTSMASPVAAGVAAAVMSYYPQLTAKDVKAILMQSAENYGKKKVALPGNPKKKVKFKKLSVTGGVVNLYNALQLAATWTPGSAK